MTTVSISDSKWTILEKIGFRFSFIYFLLFIILKNNGAYPFWYVLSKKLNDWMQQFIPWFGEHVLKLPKAITVFTNGSGDTTYDYVMVLCIFLVAVFGSLIWSLIDGDRANYKKLYYWLTVAIRFYVGLMLINYGLVKVIKLQFSEPSFYRLIEPYGDSSPMGLAWTFLGFSKGYNMFMGIAEVAAVLLLFRRTLTFGLIITLMTALNVMAVNYFYDVPVKILSTHLVLMTLFLLLRDMKKLCLFFFSKKEVTLDVIQQPKKANDNSIKIISRILKGLLLGYVFIFGFIRLFDSQKSYGTKAPKHKLFGLYEIQHFEKNGDTLSANIFDNERWRYLAFERVGNVQIHKMNKSRMFYKTQVDTLNGEFTLTSYRDSTERYTVQYQKTDSTMTFETIFKGDTLKGQAKRYTKEDFLLMNRGFNWISEYPFNR